MAPQQGKKFIFISYAHKDSGIVLPLIQGLQKRRFHVWYDHSIEAGSEWPEYIATNLLAAECVLIFLSRNADDSHNCRKELTYAINNRKNLIVLFLEDFQPSPGTDMQIQNLHALYRSRFSNDDALLDSLSKEPKLRPCLNSAVPINTSASASKTTASPAAKTGSAAKENPAPKQSTEPKREDSAPKAPPSSPHPNHRKTVPVLFFFICIAYLAYGYLTGRTIFLFYHSRFWYTFIRCVSDALFAYLIFRLLPTCAPELLKDNFSFLFNTQICCMILCPIISISVGGIFLDPSEGYWFNFCVSFLITILPALASFLGLTTDAE